MSIRGVIPLFCALIWSYTTVTNAQGIWTPKGCRIDILFIMDESGSIGSDDFETQKEFVANFTRELDISPQASQAGVVKFDSDAHLDISLHKHGSKEPLIVDILTMSYSAGGTSIHDGLRVARTHGFQEINGDRADAPNIAVLMTDGNSNYASAVNEAQLLRATGASVVAIGIGRNIDEDLLYAIASDDDSVFFIEDFDSLIDNIHMILGKSCEASQNCAGGQLDGWDGTYPMMNDCPKLHNPIIEDSQFITFYCGLNYTVSESRVSEARIQVSFLVDGVEIPESQQTVVFPNDKVALHERHLNGQLGKYISCQVQTYYTDTPTLISPEVVSRSYWAGISYSHEFVDVYENDDSPRTLLVYSTLPIGCDPDGNSCELLLDIVSEQFIAVFQNQDGQIRTCSHAFYDYNWSPSDSIAAGYPLQIAPQRDPMFGVVRTATVAVKAKDFGMKNDPSLGEGLAPYPNPWNSYSPGNITVNVHDSRDGPKTCRSTGDPRITTFDGRLFTASQIGIFTYVRSSSSRDFEINSCMIEGRCYSAGERKDVCFVCYPENHLKHWTVDPSLPKPLLISGSLYMKVEEEELVLILEAIDPLSKDIAFTPVIASEANVQLLPNGTLLWLASKETGQSDLGIRMTAVDACPRTDTVMVSLVTVSCESICGIGGNCIPDLTKPRGLGYYSCECGEGFTGEHCEHNVDECLSDPCVHGKCADATGSFTCECDPGYVGANCDTSEGSLGEWNEFGPCSKECDFGLKTRTRECHGPPCDPATMVHTLLCNEFNCAEWDGEMNEGTVLLFSNVQMQKVVEDETTTHELTAEVLNIHCNNHPRDCCSAVGLGTLDSATTPGKVFLKEDARTAKGYPQQHSDMKGVIREKILAEVDNSRFSGFCDTLVNDRHRKRQTSGAFVHSSFMNEAVSENIHIIVQGLGAEVRVEGAEVVEEKRWWIFAAIGGGVLLVVIIVLAVCLGKKCARHQASNYKEIILNEESYMDNLTRPVSAGSSSLAMLDQQKYQLPRPSVSDDLSSSEHRPSSSRNSHSPQVDTPMYSARGYTSYM